MQKIKCLFESLQVEVNYTVRKLYFECSADSLFTIEVDVFLENEGGKIIPLFIDGEIKFLGSDRQKALFNAMEFQNNFAKHPSFFGPDVTGKPAVKTRNIAVKGLPTHLETLFEGFLIECAHCGSYSRRV